MNRTFLAHERLAFRHRGASVRPFTTVPDFVKIVEVGPRDGLQNEKGVVPTDVKITLIERLAAAGLRSIEATAFVSSKWVPQMADAAAVMAGLTRKPGVSYQALVPNVHGLEAAAAAGVTEVAVFPAASEAFSKANLNCSVADSLDRCRAVCDAAAAAAAGGSSADSAPGGVPKGASSVTDSGGSSGVTGGKIAVRGYVSCALGCPYSGAVSPEVVRDVAAALMEMGCYQVSLGDTIGIGTPGGTARLLDAVLGVVPVTAVAVHFHDTYGQALANILTALQCGVSVVDSAVAGLGGCPYARGATGNVATEDVVYMLHGMGIETGVDMEGLLAASEFISGRLGRPAASRAARALLAKRAGTKLSC